MKWVLLIFLFSLFLPDNFNKIRTINKISKEAEALYLVGNYQDALSKYKFLIDSLKVEDEALMINLAHSLYKLGDKPGAQTYYLKLTDSKDKAVRSITLQQLGNIAYDQKETIKALEYFKNALRAFPENEEARYNYELLKRIIDKQNENQDKQDKEDKKKEPSDYAKRLKKQAEELAAQMRYNEAYNLMMQGWKQDKSIEYFKDFINRLKIVDDINK